MRRCHQPSIDARGQTLKTARSTSRLARQAVHYGVQHHEGSQNSVELVDGLDCGAECTAHIGVLLVMPHRIEAIVSTWTLCTLRPTTFTGPMAIAAAQAPSPAPKPISVWSAWARSGDILTAVVRPDGDTAVDGDTATVPVTIAQTVQHQSGQATPYTTYTAYVTLNDAAREWKVDNYRIDSTSL